jgi:DNA invertase Pin-like site-specific DNA recombinase
MNHARLTGSTLLIAKLDRLSRDAHFLLGLQKAGVPFVACDMPDANNLTVGIMALVAQQEREAISQRTKAALAAAKARGTKLGNPNGARCLREYAATHGNHASGATAALMARAQQRAADLQATIDQIRARGITSARGIAKALTEAHVETPRGGAWTARSVLNLLARSHNTAPSD